MALAAEAGELLEVFQWKSTDEVRNGVEADDIEAASEELADVLIFLVRLADILGIDLGEAGDKRIALNTERYPLELASVRRYETVATKPSIDPAPVCPSNVPRVWPTTYCTGPRTLTPVAASFMLVPNRRADTSAPFLSYSLRNASPVSSEARPPVTSVSPTTETPPPFAVMS
jgi:hypothetical protein